MFCGSYMRVSNKLFVSFFGEVCTPEPYLRPGGVITLDRCVYGLSLGSGEFVYFVREFFIFPKSKVLSGVNDVPLCRCPYVGQHETKDQYC